MTVAMTDFSCKNASFFHKQSFLFFFNVYLNIVITIRLTQKTTLQMQTWYKQKKASIRHVSLSFRKYHLQRWK